MLELNTIFISSHELVFYPYRTARIKNIFIQYSFEGIDASYEDIWDELIKRTTLKYDKSSKMVEVTDKGIQKDNHCCFRLSENVYIAFEDREIWFGTDLEIL